MIEKELIKAIKKAGLKADAIDVDYPEKAEFGDFSTSVAMRLAKEFGKNPRELAQKIVNNISDNKYIKKAEVAGPGFINIFATPKYWQEILAEINIKKENYGRGDKKKQKIQVEYISANPTGPLHLGHARNGYIGDVLANTFKFLGYTTTKEFYVNNAGNQVTILGKSALASANIIKSEEGFYSGDYIDKWVKVNKVFIKKNSESPNIIGGKLADYVLEELIKKTAEKMQIKFDSWFLERDLYKKKEVEASIKYLEKKGLTYKKDGATWFRASKFGDNEDRVIVKSDGTAAYITPDIAYHYDKFVVRKFDKVINVLGTDHHGYVPRLMAAVSSMGYEKNLDVILLQLVRLVRGGKEYKMSKRKGIFVTVDDLMDLIGPSTTARDKRDASDVARFFFLSFSYDTHMAFDLNLAKERSEKNPVFYVKYAYARLSGILRNAPKSMSLRGVKDDAAISKNKEIASPPARDDLNLKLLIQKEEINLIKELAKLPEVSESVIEEGKYPVHKLTHYSIEIAKSFHSFYDKCRVIDEANPELTAARLELVKATKIVLGIVGEDLIGINMPEKM